MKRGSLLMAALVANMLCATGDGHLYTSSQRPSGRPIHKPVDTSPSEETEAAKISAAEAKRARKLARNAAIAARTKEQP